MRRPALSRCSLPLVLALAASFAANGTASAQAAPAQAGHARAATALAPELVAAKAGLEKYRDPLVAIKDGYLSSVACIGFSHATTDGPVEYPAGTMGVHFLNMSNVGPTLDPAKPQVLIYEPSGGKLTLVAAEWFMPEAAAGGKAPTIFGQTLNGPMDGHEPIMPASLRHYDLHVWLWRDNPKGVFTSTNAAVKCGSGTPYALDMSQHHH